MRNRICTPWLVIRERVSFRRLPLRRSVQNVRTAPRANRKPALELAARVWTVMLDQGVK